MKVQRKHDRSIVDISIFPIKVQLSIDEESIWFGKVWDLSRHGLCVVTDNLIDTNLIGSHVTLDIWKVEEHEMIPAIVKWKDHSYTTDFYGFETDMDLMATPLRRYMN
jgi:hypothetical protein